MPHDLAAMRNLARHLPELAPITTDVRPLNHELWALLTKPGPLGAAEWRLIDEAERAGRTDDDHAGAHGQVR